MNPIHLPHGPGFRLLDEIGPVEAGPSLTARVRLNPDWPIFHDHFPGKPLLPAVYFMEMGAQASGALWAAHADFSPAMPLQLVEIRKFRIRQPAIPGEHLRITTRLTAAWVELATFDVQIFREDILLAEGEMVLANPTGGT